MRAIALALTALALAVAPSTVDAAFQPERSFAAPEGEVPVALAFSSSGRGSVVTQRGGPPYSDGVVAVTAVESGRRSVFARTVVLDSTRLGRGGVDLLVRRGTFERAGDLTLRRVLPDGRVYDLWSVRTTATTGALARSPRGTTVAWPSGTRLRWITRPDGGIPTRQRSAALGRRVWSTDLAVDPRGRLVAAVADGGRTVLLSATARGTVLRRQVVAAGGRPRLAVTPDGLVGALVEDTGIEGDGGECVADGGGRHLRVAVRRAGARSFGAVRTIESPRFGCGSGGARIDATAGGGLTVLYQGGSYDHPPLLARAAFAGRDGRFGAPTTLATDARADAAVVDARGQHVVALLRRATEPEVFRGALSVLRSTGTEEHLSPAPASAPLLARDGGGRAVLAWRTAAGIAVSLDR